MRIITSIPRCIGTCQLKRPEISRYSVTSFNWEFQGISRSQTPKIQIPFGSFTFFSYLPSYRVLRKLLPYHRSFPFYPVSIFTFVPHPFISFTSQLRLFVPSLLSQVLLCQVLHKQNPLVTREVLLSMFWSLRKQQRILQQLLLQDSIIDVLPPLDGSLFQKQPWDHNGGQGLLEAKVPTEVRRLSQKSKNRYYHLLLDYFTKSMQECELFRFLLRITGEDLLESPTKQMTSGKGRKNGDEWWCLFSFKKTYE